ncbi:MAG: hypothetical protein J0L67_09620 [Cytophagales bacterium]|nr:hypothetical protein [Cytophagales bacterium]
MKKTFPAMLFVGFILLMAFVNKPADHEQIAFDYFISDILGNDFKDVTSFEFKGVTEESYATLGKYNFCLRPEEKLGSMIKELTAMKRQTKEIDFANVSGLKITNFQSKTSGHRLFVYPSLHVAENYYVFLSFQKLKEHPIKYVFELNMEGDILRSCKME